MDSRDAIVATMTLARDAVEEQRLEHALGALRRLGLPVVVADGGSRAAFVDHLRSALRFGVESTAPGGGLVRQVKASLGAALRGEHQAILYTEPDKALFFANSLSAFLTCAPEPPALGVLIAARSPESFATFPPFQIYAERLINDLCARVTGRRGDYSYGPFLMNRRLADSVLSFADTLGWGWRHAVFGLAARRGYAIVHRVDDLPCPEDQRVEHASDRHYRLRQLDENSRGLIASSS